MTIDYIKECVRIVVQKYPVSKIILFGSREFLENEMLKRALGMTTINIGEPIKNITPELRKANPRACLKIAFGKVCITICGGFVSNEGGVVGWATLTEFGANNPQSGVCRLAE